MQVDIEVRADEDLSPAERYALGVWMWDVFGDDADGTLWSAVDWHVFVRVNGELVSHVEIIDRMCTVGGQPVRVGGVSGVATHKAWRRQGLGSQAVARAMTFMRDNLGFEFGLMSCSPKRVPFYGRLGWQVVSNRMFSDQPGGKRQDKGPVMVWCSGDMVWPEGEIDLCGLPW